MASQIVADGYSGKLSKPSLSDGGIHPWSSLEGYALEQKAAASLMQSHDQAPNNFKEKLIDKYFKDNKTFVDLEYVHELILGSRHASAVAKVGDALQVQLQKEANHIFTLQGPAQPKSRLTKGST